MLLTLIRHSKTLVDHQAPSILWRLSDEGVQALKQFKEQPDIKAVNLFYTSFQNKALETALLLAKDDYKFIRPHKGLAELTSMTNGFIKDYEKTVEEFYLGHITRINKGETIDEARQRFTDALEEIVEQSKGLQNVGIVAHANVLAVFSSGYSEQSALELHHSIKMPDYAVFDWSSKKFTKPFEA